ncbi:unnamed protein product [Fraxinus pennsylvanica]|uniref:GDT1 family protein n=1 Tax=Fraxinus pennsylvanica TaxID=56036 RepID=A0AAD1ZNB4_9LAMI|nr:unnamed protein product [Fraxinus pennsylvanica]
MGCLQSNPFHRMLVFLILFLFLSFSFPRIFAQESDGDDVTKDLGRRSKIFVDKIKTGIVRDEKNPDSINVGVGLDSGLGIFDAIFASFSMILVSEIGDETFIIAALMAMRHPKSIVLSGALSALFVMTSFVLTFLAEWGDRSQIATIALATHKSAIGVAVGAIIGHAICTSLAVVGGSILASKISQRTVAAVGGLLFLGFSMSSYLYPPL